MSLQSNHTDEEIMAEINMTPLIDIMLVLLIIFMVTSSISLDSGLDIDLPQVGTKTQGDSGKAVIVSLNDSGSVSVQGSVVGIDDLQKTIASAIEAEGTAFVILEGDKESFLGNAVEIMDLAKAAGAKRFAIAADEKL
ncbi:MAG: biopolymer transporter ExbD [Halobacteriovoraceae bacterium]|jgi:biopolymer transport protein ExbD|nr:biopolymer transporter ExbD [Halobacteriovoraceae bacterium]